MRGCTDIVEGLAGRNGDLTTRIPEKGKNSNQPHILLWVGDVYPPFGYMEGQTVERVSIDPRWRYRGHEDISYAEHLRSNPDIAKRAIVEGDRATIY